MRKIKELREQFNVSQQQLASYLKVSPSALSNWESDKREPDLATVIKIADYFNVSVDVLLGRQYTNKSRSETKEEHTLDCKRVYALLQKIDPSYYPAIEQIITGLIDKK